MVQDPRAQSPGITLSMQRSVEMVMAVGQILTAPVHVWTRKPGTCGRRYFACGPGYQGFPAPFVWAALFGGEPVPLLVGLGLVYPVGAAWHWYCRVYYERRGYYAHSGYVGDPRFGRFEAPVLVGLGLLGMVLSPAFGTYVLAAVVGEAANSDFVTTRDRAVVESMRDARIQAKRYRDMFDDQEDPHG